MDWFRELYSQSLEQGLKEREGGGSCLGATLKNLNIGL